jgi:hypothetical protein
MKLIIDYIFIQRLCKNDPKPIQRFEIGWTKTDIESLKFLNQVYFPQTTDQR